MKQIIEWIEDIRLLHLAEERAGSPTTSFADFVAEEGFDMDDLEKLATSVEIEQ